MHLMVLYTTPLPKTVETVNMLSERETASYITNSCYLFSIQTKFIIIKVVTNEKLTTKHPQKRTRRRNYTYYPTTFKLNY